MTRNSYYPARIGDQVLWLKNLRNKIPNYATALGYAAGDIAALQADADYCIYLLDTWQPAVRRFAEGATAYLRHILNGAGNVTPLPDFALPATPPPPAAVAPGALLRIFAFVKNLKTRAGYTAAIGEDLGIVGSESTENESAVPPAKGEARSGEVVITFKKMGHLGVWVEGQIGDASDWSFLAIDTSNPYNDTRPLKVPGQPEKRRYRLCFWDGDPSNVWSDIIEVTFGG